ncbi:PepSY domain-containing protein [Bacillus sp. 165]|nr:PepSY domain-containing protein [Bacillus sp. 165]
MKKTRQAHLWIGIITSAFLLMEAITGLIMTEPWLIGEGTRHTEMSMDRGAGGFNSQQGSGFDGDFQPPNNIGAEEGNMVPNGRMERGGAANSLMGIIRGLHEGRLGNMDISWVIDIAAVSMIFLTISGIYLSVKVLLRQRKAQKKQALKAESQS